MPLLIASLLSSPRIRRPPHSLSFVLLLYYLFISYLYKKEKQFSFFDTTQGSVEGCTWDGAKRAKRRAKTKTQRIQWQGGQQ
jgi:hypothetical protein